MGSPVGLHTSLSVHDTKPLKLRHILAATCMVFFTLGISGCALEAAPQPPSLEIALPVKNLTSTRAGDTVTLRWTMPKRSTDKTNLTGEQTVVVCRAALPIAPDAPCAEIARMQFSPGESAHWTDHLPAPYLAGTPRLLRYNLEMESPWQETAGLSNNATIVAGMPPAPVQGLRLTVQPDGVVLHWQPDSAMPHQIMYIERRLAAASAHAHAPNSVHAKAPMQEGPAQEQFLAVPLNQRDPGQAIDRNAALGQTYTYTLQRVLNLEVDGQEVRLAGATSLPVTINAKNVFAPVAPQGLEAVADSQAQAIDLSWAPNADPNVVGYRVYRRVQGERAANDWKAISPEQPMLTAPSWQDTNARPGVSYEYAVRAVSVNGLWSAPSSPVAESLPAEASPAQ